MKSPKELNEAIKTIFLNFVSEKLEERGEQVLRVGSNEVALPVVDEEGGEKYLVITFKVPTGSRDGEAYDGYAMAEDYEIKMKNKAEKKEKRAAEAAKKKAEREAAAAKKRAEQEKKEKD